MMITIKNSYIFILFVFFSSNVSAQNRNSVWCFGDSAGIDFNNLFNPTSFQSGMDSRGSCSSISDANGMLQFYAFTRATIGGNSGLVFNNQHQLMQNGDSILGQGWYNEVLIIPATESDSTYYLFSIGVTNSSLYGLFYSKITFDNFNVLGAVTQKNIQLQSFANVDCLNAIKHGNGRDWWVFFRRWQPGVPFLPTIKEFHSYLVSPNGISNYTIQNVGSGSYTNGGKLTFSASGDRLVLNTYAGLIEIYDFDRCTGIISNPINIFPETIGGVFNHFWGCEFSSNGQLLYVTISDQTSYLFQFDLNAPNIAASIDTLWTISNPGEAIGGLKRGPDGKIYESGPDTSPLAFSYPYSDSLYTMYNMNLGVINSPDSLGAACDFQPYSFYLGGKRTYWGLPNNPDYDLGPLLGSPCDTLVSLAPPLINIPNAELLVYYDIGWQTAFINGHNVQGTKVNLKVYDISGKIIFEENGKLNPPYYSKNLNCVGWAKGMYVVSLETETEMLTKKFVIE